MLSLNKLSSLKQDTLSENGKTVLPSDVLLQKEKKLLALFDKHCDDSSVVTSERYKGLEEQINAEILAVKERVNSLPKKNSELKLKPVPFKEKVEKWLKTFNVGKSSQNSRFSMETVTDNQIEETESLQSVDTEQYIKSNRRRTATKVTMTTIKKYYSLKNETQNHRSAKEIDCEKNQNSVACGTIVETLNVVKSTRNNKVVKRKHQTSNVNPATLCRKSTRNTQPKVLRRRYHLRRKRPSSSTNESDNENGSFPPTAASKVDISDVHASIFDPKSDTLKVSKKWKQIRKRRKKRNEQSSIESEVATADSKHPIVCKSSDVLSLNEKCIITERATSSSGIEQMFLSSCKEYLNVFPIYK